VRIVPADAVAIAAWLASDRWPYHVNTEQTPESARAVVDKGYFWDEVESFWIVDDDERVGVLRLFDLEDPTPMFDLRFQTRHRGRGLGPQALAWMADYLFEGRSTVRRIEGHTRCDNKAMRRVFEKSGWVKEGHHRRAWPDKEGTWRDSTAYAILRDDWETGTVTPVDWDG